MDVFLNDLFLNEFLNEFAAFAVALASGEEPFDFVVEELADPEVDLVLPEVDAPLMSLGPAELNDCMRFINLLVSEVIFFPAFPCLGLNGL